MKREFKIFVLWSIMLYTAFFLFGNDMPSFGQEDNIDDLKNQIRKLQQRVEELEAEKKHDLQPHFMFNGRKKDWNPVEELNRMQAEMDRMVEESFNWRGNINSGLFASSLFYDKNFRFKDENDKYILEFDITGLNQDKIEINVDGQHITLKCESGAENTQQDKNSNYYSKSYSTFYKSFPLPEDADTLSMKTEKKDDKLLINLPKKIN